MKRMLAILLGMALLGGCSFDEANRREASTAETTTTALSTAATVATTTTATQTTTAKPTSLTTTIQPTTIAEDKKNYDKDRLYTFYEYLNTDPLYESVDLHEPVVFSPNSDVTCRLLGLEKQPDPHGEGQVVYAKLDIQVSKLMEVEYTTGCGQNHISQMGTDGQFTSILQTYSGLYNYYNEREARSNHPRKVLKRVLVAGSNEFRLPVAWYPENLHAYKCEKVQPLIKGYALTAEEGVEVLEESPYPKAWTAVRYQDKEYRWPLDECLEKGNVILPDPDASDSERALVEEYQQALGYDEEMVIDSQYAFSRSMSCRLKGVEVQPDPEGEGVLVYARMDIISQRPEEIQYSNICGWNYMLLKTDAEDVTIHLWDASSRLLLESSRPEKQHRRKDTAVSLSRGATEVLLPVAWYGPDPEAQKLAAVEQLGAKYGLDAETTIQTLKKAGLPVRYALIDINTVVHLLDLTEILEAQGKS